MDSHPTRRTLAGLLGAGLLASTLVAACTSDPESEMDGSVQGMLRDDCGPTDGPVLYASLGSSQTLTCEDPSRGEFTLSVDGRLVDSLEAGQVLEDTVSICIAPGCTPVTYYRLEVDGVSADRIRGTLEVSESENGALVKKRYRAELKKCPMIYQCG